MRLRALHFILVLFALSSSGCSLFRAIIIPSYHKASLADSQVTRDIKYYNGPGFDSQKHRLDLFVPKAKKNWPVMVFVHGGEWISGDKGLKVLGADIYSNIGRFYASKGIGVAVINYRLLPTATWTEQVGDVARSVEWVRKNIRVRGGNPNAIYLAGHSSGAQVAAKVSLDDRILNSLGLSRKILKGVILISGAGYDLTDEETLELAAKEHLFQRLFHKGRIPLEQRQKMSPIRDVSTHAPPFLILYSEKEEKELKEESIRLHARLRQNGIRARLIQVPDSGHKTIVLSVSDPARTSSRAILDFIIGEPQK